MKVDWGKPRIWVKDVDTTGAKWYELPTPVEDSTQLVPTKGEKKEAKIEGGDNEDVLYKKSTYTLSFNIRKLRNSDGTMRKAPFPVEDGIVTNRFAVMLQPEDPQCEGFYIESTTVGVDDTYTAADGAMWQCQLDALVASTGDTVKWGLVEFNGTANPATLSFTERTSKEISGTSDTYYQGNIADAS